MLNILLSVIFICSHGIQVERAEVSAESWDAAQQGASDSGQPAAEAGKTKEKKQRFKGFKKVALGNDQFSDEEFEEISEEEILQARDNGQESPAACVWEEQTDNQLTQRILDNTWVDCFDRTVFTDSIRKHIDALTQFMKNTQVDKTVRYDQEGSKKQGMDVQGSTELYYKQFKNQDEPKESAWATDMLIQISVSIASIIYTNQQDSGNGLYYLFPIIHNSDGLGMLERKIEFTRGDFENVFTDPMTKFSEWVASTYDLACWDFQGFDNKMSVLRMTDVMCLPRRMIYLRSATKIHLLADVLLRLMRDCANYNVPEEITILSTP